MHSELKQMSKKGKWRDIEGDALSEHDPFAQLLTEAGINIITQGNKTVVKGGM